VVFIRKQIEPIATEERKRDRDHEHLLEQLSDPNPTARRWAARDLVNYGGAGPLLACLKIEPEVSVREVILTTLIRLAEPSAVAGLVDCLRSEDAALRNEAIEAMKELPDDVAPMMQHLLTDTDPDVRIFAVDILESLCHPEVEAWLINVIETDTHLNVCATAVNLLCEVGTEAAIEPLVRLNTRFAAEPYIQFAVDVAMKRIQES
jgi:HEAT repeat protein